jgi:hypothetical protein
MFGMIIIQEYRSLRLLTYDQHTNPTVVAHPLKHTNGKNISKSNTGRNVLDNYYFTIMHIFQGESRTPRGVTVQIR